jgi:hypothetical protein
MVADEAAPKNKPADTNGNWVVVSQKSPRAARIVMDK